MAGTPKRRPTFMAFLEQAGRGKSVRTYRHKEVIYSQGTRSDAVLYVQSGFAKLTVSSKRKGRKALLAVLREGDFFGEGSMGTERQRMSTATAIGACTITRLEPGLVQRKLARDMAFAAMFIARLLLQIGRLKADLADHFLSSSERRLARILLMNQSMTHGPRSGRAPLQFSQTALAEMVGTTRSRVNSFMNEFRKKGYIHYNGGLLVNSERLAAFLEA